MQVFNRVSELLKDVGSRIKKEQGVNGVNNGASNSIMIRAEVNFWKAECLKLTMELRNANKGIMRLVKRRAKYKDTARACKESYIHGKAQKEGKENGKEK